MLEKCGQPISQKSYIREININISAPINGGGTTGTAVRTGNTIQYYSNTQAPTYVSQQEVKKIEYTEINYKTGKLIFENGVLVQGYKY